ncbi:MAG: hypothetical protein PCFJNLEI_01654 [Verrucomicrobiae bacterium]|nr:hypothetical protein [Verrucomicrobiae bacterium]
MKLHIVDSGNPDPLPERFGSAFLIEIGAELILVACGPATS